MNQHVFTKRLLRYFACILTSLTLFTQAHGIDQARLIKAASNIKLSTNPADQAIVLKHIKEIHLLRGANKITGMQYQNVMAWHQIQNLSNAKIAVANLGDYKLNLQKIASDAGEWRVGSDTDFLVSRKDGNPITLEDIKLLEKAYRQQTNKMIEKLGKGNVSPLPELYDTCTDFMVAHDATTPTEFAKIAEHFSTKGADTYARIEAARVEANMRSGNLIGIDDGRAYLDEMIDQVEGKQKKINDLKARLGQATPEMQELMKAEIGILEYERNKYLKRINALNENLAIQGSSGKPSSTIYVPDEGESFDTRKLRENVSKAFIDSLVKSVEGSAIDSAKGKKVISSIARELHQLPAEQRALQWKYLDLPDEFKLAIQEQIKYYDTYRSKLTELLKKTYSKADLEKLKRFLSKTTLGQEVTRIYRMDLETLGNGLSQRSTLFDGIYENGFSNFQTFCMFIEMLDQVQKAKSDAELAMAIGHTIATFHPVGLAVSLAYAGITSGDPVVIYKAVVILICPTAALPQMVEALGLTTINLASRALMDHQLDFLYATAVWEGDNLVRLEIDGVATSIDEFLDDALISGRAVDGALENAKEWVKENGIGGEFGGEFMQGLDSLTQDAFSKGLESTIYGGDSSFMADNARLQQARAVVQNYTSLINDFADGLKNKGAVVVIEKGELPLKADASWEGLSNYEEASRIAFRKLLSSRSEAWAVVKRVLGEEIKSYLENRHKAITALKGGSEALNKMQAKIEQIFRDLDIYDLGMSWLEYEGTYNSVMKWIVSTKEQRIKLTETLQRYIAAYSQVLAIRTSVEQRLSMLQNGEVLKKRILTGMPPLTGDPVFDLNTASTFGAEFFEMLSDYAEKLLTIKKVRTNDSEAQLDSDFDNRIYVELCVNRTKLLDCDSITSGASHIKTRVNRLFEFGKFTLAHLKSEEATRKRGEYWDKSEALFEEFKDYYDSIEPVLTIETPPTFVDGKGVTDKSYVFKLKSAGFPPDAKIEWFLDSVKISEEDTLFYSFESPGTFTLKATAHWSKSGRAYRDGDAEASLDLTIGQNDKMITIVPEDKSVLKSAIQDKRYTFRAEGNNIPESAVYKWTIGESVEEKAGPELDIVFSNPGSHGVAVRAEWKNPDSPDTMQVEQSEVLVVSVTESEGYKLEVSALGSGEKLTTWIDGRGMVELPDGTFATGKRIHLAAKFVGERPKETIYWKWTANRGSRVANPASPRTHVVRNEPGIISLSLMVTNKQYEVLAETGIELKVVDLVEEPEDASEPSDPKQSLDETIEITNEPESTDSSQTDDLTTNPRKSETKAGEPSAVHSPLYKWIMTEVEDYLDTERLNKTNNRKNASYAYDVSASQGSFYSRTEFIGPTDRWYNPPRLHGESASFRANWSHPPSSFLPGEKISLRYSIGIVGDNQSFYSFSSSTGATFDHAKITPGYFSKSHGVSFRDKEGKSGFGVDKHIGSLSGTVSATAPRVGEEGDEICIMVTLSNTGAGSVGTKYYYRAILVGDKTEPIELNPKPESEFDVDEWKRQEQKPFESNAKIEIRASESSPLMLGTTLTLTAIVQDGDEEEWEYFWSDGDSGQDSKSTTIRIERPGDITIVADVKGSKGTNLTATFKAEVDLPSFSIKLTPSEPYLDETVTAEITSKPSLGEDIMHYRWIEPSTKHRLELNDQASRVEIHPLKSEGMKIEVQAKTDHYGDDLGEITAMIPEPKLYKIEAETVKRGVQPRTWKEGKGLVELPANSFATNQRVEVDVKFKGDRPKGSIYWKWSANEGTFISNPGSQSPTVSRTTAGNVTLEVRATNKDYVTLAKTTLQFAVVEPQKEPEKPKDPLEVEIIQEKDVVKPKVTVRLQAKVKGGKQPYQYEWKGEGIMNASSPTAFFKNSFEKTFDIQLVVTDALGQTVSANTAITVDKLGSDEDKQKAFDENVARAKEYEATGQYDTAIDIYRKAQEIKNDSAIEERIGELQEKIDEQKKYNDLVRSGRDQIRSGQFESAIESLREAQEIKDSRNLQSFIREAEAGLATQKRVAIREEAQRLAEKGRYQEALDKLEEGREFGTEQIDVTLRDRWKELLAQKEANQKDASEENNSDLGSTASTADSGDWKPVAVVNGNSEKEIAGSFDASNITSIRLRTTRISGLTQNDSARIGELKFMTPSGQWAKPDKITASSTYPSYAAVQASDGDMEYRYMSSGAKGWASASANQDSPEWLQFDFEHPVTLTNFVLTTAPSNPYRIHSFVLEAKSSANNDEDNPSTPSDNPTGSGTGENADQSEASNASGGLGGVAGEWEIDGNGYKGVLTINPTGTSYVNYQFHNRDEALNSVSYDPATRTITFTRPINSSYSQVYTGTLDDEGVFVGKFVGGGTYSWWAKRAEAKPDQ